MPHVKLAGGLRMAVHESRIFIRYTVFMSKRAVSLTLDESNLVWLRGQASRRGARSLSHTVDQLITLARTAGLGTPRAVRSVAGTIDLDATDPQLASANEAVRALFHESLARPLVVMEPAAPFTPHTTRRRGTRRG